MPSFRRLHILYRRLFVHRLIGKEVIVVDNPYCVDAGAPAYVRDFNPATRLLSIEFSTHGRDLSEMHVLKRKPTAEELRKLRRR